MKIRPFTQLRYEFDKILGLNYIFDALNFNNFEIIKFWKAIEKLKIFLKRKKLLEKFYKPHVKRR